MKDIISDNGVLHAYFEELPTEQCKKNQKTITTQNPTLYSKIFTPMMPFFCVNLDLTTKLFVKRSEKHYLIEHT